MAYFRVHSRAVYNGRRVQRNVHYRHHIPITRTFSYSALFVLYRWAISGTRGSSGFGSQSRLQMESNTLLIVNAGDPAIDKLTTRSRQRGTRQQDGRFSHIGPSRCPSRYLVAGRESWRLERHALQSRHNPALTAIAVNIRVVQLCRKLRRATREQSLQAHTRSC